MPKCPVSALLSRKKHQMPFLSCGHAGSRSCGLYVQNTAKGLYCSTCHSSLIFVTFDVYLNGNSPPIFCLQLHHL